MEPRAVLRALFDAALDAARPAKIVPPWAVRLELPKGRLVVIGAGKASAAMAQAVESHFPEAQGLVITRYGAAVPCQKIEIVEAAHPVPDAAGVRATRRILQETLSGLTKDDLVLCLLSGGGSSLLTLPAEGISLEEKQDITRSLLRSGATIAEMNCVRKHLSAVKGGRLALACAPARLTTWLISDVPGNDPATIASGPTVPDPTTREGALHVLDRFQIVAPSHIRAYLGSPKAETPKPGDTRFGDHQVCLLASPEQALDAACVRARTLGLEPLFLGADLQGEARELGDLHAAVALHLRAQGKPMVILSGGETTVTVRGSGSGGRNVEYLAGLAQALRGRRSIYALAADTDGIDGQEETAGAYVDPTTLARGHALGMDIDNVLLQNDAHTFFRLLGDSVVTGPTRTNVNDFRAILALP